MSDWPRFEQVKGPPDTAHEHYFGGRLAGFVFHLVDRWRGSAGAATVRAAPALDLASGQTEIHERPPQQGAVAERFAADELLQAHARLAGLFPDETFSRSFLLGSARTRRLQAALLATFVAVVAGLLVQTVVSTREQPPFAERPIPSAQGVAP